MNGRPPIGFTVVGGYLGAGKTTLMNELLARADGRRFGVVVNDIGAVNIDAALIDSDEGDLVTLSNGCVCCAVVDGFQQALSRLLEPARAIEHVLVEVSGVGDPWRVAQWGRTPGFELEAVLVLADVTEVQRWAMDPYVGETVLAQLRGGDLVVATKTDLAADGGAKGVEWLESVGDAPVLVAPRGARTIVELLDAAQPGAGSGSAQHRHADHRVWTVTARPGLARETYAEWLAAAPAGVVRVKGLVEATSGALLVQRVGRRCEVTRTRNPRGLGSIVVVATPAVDATAVQGWLSAVTAPVASANDHAGGEGGGGVAEAHE